MYYILATIMIIGGVYLSSFESSETICKEQTRLSYDNCMYGLLGK